MAFSIFLHSRSYTSISSSLNPTTNNNNVKPHSTLTNLQTNVDQNTQDLKIQSQPISHANATIRVPTPPWLKGPLQLQPHELLNLSNLSKNKNPGRDTKGEKPDMALTGKESGMRRKKAMAKIVKSIERLRVSEGLVQTRVESCRFELSGSLEQLGDSEEKKNLMPWERGVGKFVFWSVKKEKVVTLAELTLDKELLKRLRVEAKEMKKWVKVKKAGVTKDVVDQIRLAWKRNELAMAKFDVPLCEHMSRAREILEMKTGGLVVWTWKDVHVVYRGKNYRSLKIPVECSTSEKMHRKSVDDKSVGARLARERDVGIRLHDASLFERETDRLLDGLGPRFVDWWMQKPLPVDADMLPDVVSGFKTPSRLCPPHARSKLKDDELTYLRKLARALPTHFVLGRNRKLQGLAAAVLKLWEKCVIAKIAIKWGIPNTDNEQMADELKRLTGGTLLLRNKFFVILYRGKDFLTDWVANLVEDREVELRNYQLDEENARLKAIDSLYLAEEPSIGTGKAGTLNEFQEIQTRYGNLGERSGEHELQIEVEKENLLKELRILEHKLLILKSKVEKSERELSKLNAGWTPVEPDQDVEMMTEEERECLQEIGLKMHSSLVLGRRGIFDGVMEGLYQHWKHREVVKVITMQKSFAQVMETANLLEAESGGILVSVDKLKEGHAIIIYRGKNYRRPPKKLTGNLLTKRKALQRSLLLQRIGSLKFFAYQRQLAISKIKLKLEGFRNLSNRILEAYHNEL